MIRAGTVFLMVGLALVCDATGRTGSQVVRKKGWANMDLDGGRDVEYPNSEHKETFSAAEYNSDDPNDDENGYDGDYNTAETDRPDGEEDAGDADGAEHANAEDEAGPESLLQAKSAKHHVTRGK